jgi:glycerol-3-phosphate acyltransferase PlsY
MEMVKILLASLLAYLAGSIPFGLIVVKIASGKDVRSIGSGRTGGTNAMRAAGWFAGLLTVLGDVGKGLASGWIAEAFFPGNNWVKVAAALLAIIGHNYSIFLVKKNELGRLKFEGGAGGATCVGGAMALWMPSLWIIFPISMIVYLLVGYASVTTISVAVAATIIFTVRALVGLNAYAYIIYGILSLVIVLIALRPNLERLKKGTERVVGLRAYFLKKKQQLLKS